MNLENIISDIANEFDLRNGAQCDNEKAELRGNDNAIDLTWDRYERHDDKIHAISHLLRYGFGIDLFWKSNCYGYVTEFTLKGNNIDVTTQINLQGYITKWIESEKRRIREKYFD